MILGIKTASPQSLRGSNGGRGNPGELVLFDGTKTYPAKLTLDSTLSEKILPSIDKLLKKNGTAVKDIAAIVIFRGPGSFTSLRIGHAVANTLGLALKIPVIGVTEKQLGAQTFRDYVSKAIIGRKQFQTVLPFYGGQPNITKSKKR